MTWLMTSVRRLKPLMHPKSRLTKPFKKTVLLAAIGLFGLSSQASATLCPIDYTSGFSERPGKQHNHGSAFVGIKSDGSLKTWGHSSYGGSSNFSGSYTAVESNNFAIAALQTDGTIRAAGHGSYGGSAPAGTGYTDLASTTYAFAALNSDSTIRAWGHSSYGGSNPGGSGYASLASTQYAFAALKTDGGIRAWGYSTYGGSGAPGDTGYTSIASNIFAFAALKSDGSIYAWGRSGYGGTGEPTDNGYVSIYSTGYAFAALKADGSITTWGNSGYGVSGTPTDNGYISISSNFYSFAAMKADGSITAWGNASNGGSGAPTDSGYSSIYSNYYAFAATKPDGSITAWGNTSNGGTGGPTDNGYVSITSTQAAFAALKADGSITSWGNASYGGTGAPTGAGHTSISSNFYAFTALKSDGGVTGWGNATYYSNIPADTGFTTINGRGPGQDANCPTVFTINYPPSISGVPTASVDEDSAYSFTPTATDPENSQLSYSLSNAPSWLNINSSTGALSGTPGNADVGVASGIVITVTDAGGESDSLPPFSLTVVNTNDAPTVENAIVDQNATEEVAFSFTVPANIFQDVDALDRLSLSVQGSPPSWLAFNSITNQFSGTPANADVGAHSITVIAYDGTVSVSDTFVITVANVNDAPTLDNPLADQLIDEDVAYGFTIPSSMFSDMDAGDSFTIDVQGMPSWLSYNSSTGVLSGTPGNSDIGSTDLTVTADDGELSTSDVFTLTVQNVNDAPALVNALPDQNATEDALFSFTPPSNTFSDIDVGDSLTYSAQGLPSWLSFSTSTRTFSGTPANADVGTHSVVFRASDGSLTGSDTFVITVANVNDAPSLNSAVADQTIDEDSPFSFSLPSNTFSDADVGDSLTYSTQGALPSWLSFNAGTRVLSGTPRNVDVGIHSVTIAASDGVLSATDTFVLTVQNVNDAPTVNNALLDQSVNEDASYSFTIPANTFNDVDAGDSLSLSIQGALPAWLSYDTGTRVLSGTPGNANVGSTSVTVAASDGTLSSTDTFVITVQNVNDAPTLDNPLSDQTIDEDTAYSFTIPSTVFSDMDAGDSFTIGVQGLPSWLSYNTSTGVLSGTPSNSDVGSVDLTVVANDGELTTADVFRLTVQNINDAPTLANALADQNATEDAVYSFTVPNDTFSDVDAGDSLTLSVQTMPSWLSYSASTRTLSGTPSNNDIGTHNVTLAVTDGNLSVTDTYVITVANVNDAPTLNQAVADQSIDEDSSYSFTVPANTFSDVDAGDSLSYSVQGALSSWLSFDAGTRVLSGTPRNADVGGHNVTLAASDGTLIATDTFVITVQNVNDAPAVNNPLADQSVNEDASYSFTIPANTFIDVDAGDSLSYSVQGSLPTWLSYDTGSRVLSGTPSNTDVGAHSVTIRASDSSLSVSDTFVITVQNVNDAPTLSNAIADQSVNEDTAFSFTVPSNTFADVDAGDSLTLSMQSALPEWLSFNASTGVFSGTPTNADVGTHTLTLRAADGALGVTDSFEITVVNVNDAPVVANPLADQTISEDAAYSFSVPDGSFVDADAGDSLSIGVQGSLPTWLSYEASTGELTGTPRNNDVGAHTVSFVASDGTLSVTDSFVITVQNVNDAPTLANAIADQSVDEDSSFAFVVPSNTFSDDDAGASLSLSVSSVLPAWLDFNTTTGLFSGTPTNSHVGVVVINLQASDGSLTASDSFQITVNNTNDSPTVANPVADQTATEDAAFSFTVPSDAFEDVDASDSLTYAVDSALPNWLSFNASTRVFSGTPGNDDVGGTSVTLNATDGTATATDVFVIQVQNKNDGPTLENAISNQSVNEDVGYFFAVPSNTFGDVDTGDTLSLSLTEKPAWLSFAASTQTLSGTPANDHVGSSPVRLRATDGSGLYVETEFVLTVNNANDAPTVDQGIADQQTLENQPYLLNIPADAFSDVDAADALQYSLVGAPAWLTVDQNSLHGTPAQADVGTITVTVRATDNAGDSVQTEFDLEIVAVDNDAPVFSSSGDAAVDENTSGVFYTATASDPDSSSVSFSLLSGGDGALFSLNTSSGELSFVAAPNAESPADDNGDNVYHVTLRASDSANNANDLALRVTVRDLNDSVPVFSSVASHSIAEGSNNTGYIARATDQDDGDTVHYSLASSVDSVHFDIDNNSGLLSFSSASDFENPVDDDSDNVYEVLLRATDDAGNSSTLALQLTVTDSNDGTPVFSSAASVDVDENTASDFYTAIATDSDTSDTVQYSLSTAKDGSLFSIDANNGKLRFSSAPDAEQPTDSDTDGYYVVDLLATDAAGQSGELTLVVRVQDLNDNAPSFTSAASQSTLEGNLTTGYTAQATDPDAVDAPAQSISYAIAGGSDAAHFSINAQTGVLSFANLPDFESPQDSNEDNRYVVQLSATDRANQSSVHDVVITVQNTNDNAPVFSSSPTVSVQEGTSGTFYTALAQDQDSGDSVTYSIVSGNSDGIFSLNTNTGELSSSALDYEQPGASAVNNVYLLSLRGTDSAGLYRDFSLAVQVQDANDNAPVFQSASSWSIDENTRFIGLTLNSVDVDLNDSLSYSIVGGADRALFEIDGNNGLNFISPSDAESPLDSDQNNVFEVTVRVSDAAGNSTDQAIEITVTDVNDSSPVFTSASNVSVAEGTLASPYTALATDSDDGDQVQYVISGGDDGAMFTLDANTGVLRFDSVPDVENPLDLNKDNTYRLILTASDVAGNQSSHSLEVKVTDINDSTPVFSSSNFVTVDEGQLSTGYIAAATDLDRQDQLQFAVGSGGDSARFAINATSGALKFLQAADFDNPGDSDGNNTYQVTLEVTDAAGHSSSLVVTVVVLNVNDEVPVFRSASAVQVTENTDSIFYTVNTTDIDASDSVAYRIEGGEDGHLFRLNSVTGALRFAISQDAENPSDRDADGDYEITLRATDSANNSSTLDLTVTLQNINEEPIAARQSARISETATSGTAMKTLSAQDPEGDNLTWTLLSSSSPFALSTDGALSLVGYLDYETTPSYTLSAGVSDGELSTVVSIDVEIEDASEETSFIQLSPLDVTVFSANGIVGAYVGREAFYESVIAASDTPTTRLELQYLVDLANAVADAVDEARSSASSDAADFSLTEKLIKAGIADADQANAEAYRAAVQAVDSLPLNTAELQQLVDQANDLVQLHTVSAEIAEGESPASDLKPLLVGYNGLPDELLSEFAGLVYKSEPKPYTAQEINALIDALNTRAQNHPVVYLRIEQDGQPVQKIRRGQGPVTVVATYSNYDVDPQASYDWSESSAALLFAAGSASNTDKSISFDPDIFETDVEFHAYLTVSLDDMVSESELAISYLDEDSNALEAIDSDNDGISDVYEGELASYETHKLQSVKGEDLKFVMETEAGQKLRMGSAARRANAQQGALDFSTLQSIEPTSLIRDELFTEPTQVYDFEVTALPRVGASATVLIPLDSPLPAGAVYRSFHPALGWQDFNSDHVNKIWSAPALANIEGLCPPLGHSSYTEGLTTGDQCVRVMIEDGGVNDGDRLTFNGQLSADDGLNGTLNHTGAIVKAHSDGSQGNGENPAPPETSVTGGSVGYALLLLLMGSHWGRRRFASQIKINSRSDFKFL